MINRLAAAVIIAATLLASADAWSQEGAQDAERFPTDRLVQGLLSRNLSMQASAMQSLEEYGPTPEVAEVLITVLDRRYKRRSRLQSTTLDMLRLLAKIDTDNVADAMLKYLDAPHHEFLIAAVDQLSRRRDPRALEPLLSMHEHPQYEVAFGLRRCVTEGLSRYPDKRVVEYALARLPTARGSIRHDLLRFLMRVGRQQFGADPETWNVWWNDNRDDFEFPEEDTATVDDSGNVDIKGLDVPRCYDMPVYADRVVFVLDRSDSMATGDEVPKLEAAKNEMKAAIQSLGEQTHFAIIIFDGRVRSWRRELVAADSAAKKAAIDYLDGIDAGQGTASHDALTEALGMDDNTEAVFFVSDGSTDEGDMMEPDEIVRQIAKENFFRRVTLYSIGVEVAGASADFMSSLAAETGGFYHGPEGVEAPEAIARGADNDTGRDETGRPARSRDSGETRYDEFGRPIRDSDS